MGNLFLVKQGVDEERNLFLPAGFGMIPVRYDAAFQQDAFLHQGTGNVGIKSLQGRRTEFVLTVVHVQDRAIADAGISDHAHDADRCKPY